MYVTDNVNNLGIMMISKLFTLPITYTHIMYQHLIS